MKVLTSKIHGIADYVTGITLLAAPYVFGFADIGGAPTIIPMAIGGMIIAQSLITRYELSLLKIVPLRVHLMLDYGASLLLAASPFLFGFSDEAANVWLPHVAVGVGYFIISLLTKNEPEEL